MKIIRTKLLRLIGKKDITTPWAIFAAPKAKITEVDMNHAKIHQKQWRELWYIGFIFWYFFEWLIKSIIHVFDYLLDDKDERYFSWHSIYKSIGFEREAFRFDDQLDYLLTREKCAFIFYI